MFFAVDATHTHTHTPACHHGLLNVMPADVDQSTLSANIQRLQSIALHEIKKMFPKSFGRLQFPDFVCDDGKSRICLDESCLRS